MLAKHSSKETAARIARPEPTTEGNAMSQGESKDLPLFAAARAAAEALGLSGDAARVTITTVEGWRLSISRPRGKPVAPPAAPPATQPPAPAPRPQHSTDFRSLRWGGRLYAFTEPQATALRVLWENFQRGTPDVGDRVLVSAAGSASQRLADVFRDNPAWGTLIVEGGTRGTHRLADPGEAAGGTLPFPAELT